MPVRHNKGLFHFGRAVKSRRADVSACNGVVEFKKAGQNRGFACRCWLAGWILR
jgi:hypothetical protein